MSTSGAKKVRSGTSGAELDWNNGKSGTKACIVRIEGCYTSIRHGGGFTASV